MSDSCVKCGEAAQYHVNGLCPLAVVTNWFHPRESLLMAKVKGKSGEGKERRAFAVVVVNKGKITHRYDCGSSIRGANQCLRSIQDFGMGKFEKATVVVIPTEQVAKPDQIGTLQDLEASL